MGANLTKEYDSTWNQKDVEAWKEKAIEVIKSYYLSFRGSQFDEYMLGEDENLLLAKICFSIYGPPTVKDAREIWEGYEMEQLENAMEILKLILEVHKNKNNSSKRLLVGIIVIACKQEESEYVLPMFSIFTGHEPSNPHAARSYVDTQRRIYDSWEDWKNNSTLPMLKYAYPTRGFFTASLSCSYEFDPNKDPDVSFGTSPACKMTSRVFGTADTLTAVTSLACGVIGVASMLTPIGPSILLASAVGGGGSALYGTSRAVVRLYDKRTHGGSLTDLESFTLWFSIAATPLHFTTSIVNASLVRGAVVNGRIFSSSMRMFATVLNFSTLGVDGVMIAFGIANLVDKYKQDQLQPLDVLQFSMSVFFFTNTLIQPKMATSIIKNAQDTHIQSYANNLSDADAQATFNKFLDSNKGDGGIKDTSKIVRTINRINDPNKLFGNLKDHADIKIGGRKGKTILVTDQKQNVQRINPNKLVSSVGGSGEGFKPQIVNPRRTVCDYEGKKDWKIDESPQAEAPEVQQAEILIKKFNLSNFEINGKKIFTKLNLRQACRLTVAISAVGFQSKLIVEKALAVCREMRWDTLADVLSVVEILTAEVKKNNPGLKMSEVEEKYFEKFDNSSFGEGISNDIKIANDTANKSSLKFESPLMAVSQYRKFGADFPKAIGTQQVEVYLSNFPDDLINGNLINFEHIESSEGVLVQKIFVTQECKFIVTIENVMRKVSPASGVHIQNISKRINLAMGFKGKYSFLIHDDESEDRSDDEDDN